MKYLPFVLKNVFRKRTRSLLTIGSILLPLFVICILGTLLRALETDPSGGKGMYRLITRHKVSITNWLLESQGPKIRQVPGVVELLRMNWFGGSYIDQSAKNQFARFSTSDPEALLRVFDEVSITEGSAKEWIQDRTGALVGGILMKKYGWKLGQKIPLKGDIYPITLELTIRAVYKGPDETGLYFHHAYIEEALPRVKGYVGWYWIKAASPEAAAKIPAQVDALFENSDHPTRTETEKEFQNGWVSMLGNVKLLLTSIAAIIGFVILLIAANTMAMAARERITEIAVLRTLGYPKGTILGMILGESVLLALFGGFLGLGLFTLLYPGFRRAIQYSPMGGFAAGMGAHPDPLLLGAAFFAAILIGVLAGLVPAVRASQRTITDGLRQVA
jgi:putative ABC transport system permease protein